ncbi:hypothetical protein RYX36_000288 [Vicia faba]
MFYRGYKYGTETHFLQFHSHFIILNSAELTLGGRTPKKDMEGEGCVTGSKIKGAGNQSSKDIIFRDDRIDLKNLDAQLEKHLSKVWSRNTNESKTPKEECRLNWRN